METNDNIKESINSLKDIAESKEAIVEFKSILEHCLVEVQSKIPNRFMDELNDLSQ